MKLILVILFSTKACWALNLDGFLDQVKNRHRGLKSYEISKEAAMDRMDAGDISLVPVLTLKGSWLEDKKQPNFLGASSSQSTLYTLGLSKKLSTGTQINLSAQALGSENKDLQNPALTSFQKYAQGSLGVAVSQSLWKDFFGASTRLRREREATQQLTEMNSYDLQQKQLLIDAETTYWDFIYLREELLQRKSSLDRAQKIESWVRRRANDGIADRADSLNAQALVATRKLQLLITQDEVMAIEKSMKSLLEISDSEMLPELLGQIDTKRDIKGKFKSSLKNNFRVVRLDAYLSQLEAKNQKTISQQVEDSYKSDLTLMGSYNTNSFEPTGSTFDATKNWDKKEFPTTTVSLTWTYIFDTSTKSAARTSVRKDALAAQLRSERKSLESDMAWQELLRRNSELDKKIEAVRNISLLQKERTKAEQLKFSKGRSITANVINSEQDAAEAELNLIKLLAEQRKLESQSQLFVSMEEK